MSDGGWYGYPQQEPDPYAQAQDDWNRPPLDYSNPAQAPGYPSYGQAGQQPSAQYYDYPQQPDPRYPQQPSQNPYVQQGRPGQAQGQAQAQSGQSGYGSGSYDTGGYERGGYESGSYGTGSYDTGGYGAQRPPQRPAGQQPRVGYNTGSYPSGSYDAPGYNTQGYASGGYDTGNQRPATGYPAGSGAAGAAGEPGGPGTAAGPAGRGRRGAPADPYADPARGPRDARDPRGAARDPRAAARDPYSDLAEPADDPDYEYPARGGRRRAESEQSAPARTGSHARYDAADEDGDRVGLLTAGDDSDDDEPGTGGKKRGGSGKKERKRKSCLVIFVFFSILAGLLGYGGFQGYNWYQSKYGPPPDYPSATGIAATVVVQIRQGSGGTQIGAVLYQNDVVKSQRAFTKACEANPKCGDIQANTYLLHKEMSAAAAVEALLNTNNVYNKSQLLVRPGERAADVFKDLEQKTGWTQAQILAAIGSGKVDLPSWAGAKTGPNYPFANVEGLLFTGTYQLPDYKDPTSLVKAMIDQQLAMFNGEGLQTKAASVDGLKLSPYQVLIVASMARAEAGTDTSDLGKIAGVIYHRLKDTADFAHLGFDTTTLYGMGETSTSPDNRDAKNPYNTSVYGIKGLPPGPIDSVDQATLEAALNPSDNTDLYFCAVDGTVLYAADSSAWAQLGKEHPKLCGN